MPDTRSEPISGGLGPISTRGPSRFDPTQPLTRPPQAPGGVVPLGVTKTPEPGGGYTGGGGTAPTPQPEKRKLTIEQSRPIEAETPPPIQSPTTPPASSPLPEGPRMFARPGTSAAIPFRGVRFGAMAAPDIGGQAGVTLPGLPDAMGMAPPMRRPDEDETRVLGILDRLQGK